MVKNLFYPDHYLKSNSIDIQTILYTTSKLLDLAAEEMEHILQMGFLSHGVSETYAQTIFSYFDLPYVSEKMFDLLKKQFVPTGFHTIEKNFLEVFPEISNVLFEQQGSSILLVGLVSKSPEDFIRIQKMKPFFDAYLSVLLPPFWMTRIYITYPGIPNMKVILEKTISDLELYSFSQLLSGDLP